MVHVDRLASIVEHGLLSDNQVRSSGFPGSSIAYQSLKDRRARTAVTCGVGGTLADYVPFYFAPRSPMLWAMKSGRVNAQATQMDDILYLVSSTQDLRAAGRTVVVTDRHPMLAIAAVTDDDSALDGDFVDWAVMRMTYWKDHKDRRQAECLAHPNVAWDLIRDVGVRSPNMGAWISDQLARLGLPTSVTVRPGWYE